MTETSTVMTFNVRVRSLTDFPNNWYLRKRACRRMLEAVKPDVVALQEASNSQIKYLEYCNLKAVVFKGKRIPVLYNQLNTFVNNVEVFWLSETIGIPSKLDGASYVKKAYLVDMYNYALGRFVLLNLHLNYDEGIGFKELKIALEHLNKYTSGLKNVNRCIVLGDFNMLPSARLTDCMMTEGFELKSLSVESSPTYNGFGKKDMFTTDYIFGKNVYTVTTGIDTCGYNAVGGYLSDHYPVIAELEKI